MKNIDHNAEIERLNQKIASMREDEPKAVEKALAQDVPALMDAINSIEAKKPVLRHCYNTGGTGYFTVFEGDKKAFAASTYDLWIAGAAWSIYNWTMMLTAQELLERYLHALQSALIGKGIDVTLDIRQLYLPLISYDFSGSSIWDQRVVEAFVAPKQKEYLEKHPDDMARYNELREQDKSWYDYYNEGCTEYTILYDILQHAMKDIYKARETLEKYDMWGEAKEIIAKLNTLAAQNIPGRMRF